MTSLRLNLCIGFFIAAFAAGCKEEAKQPGPDKPPPPNTDDSNTQRPIPKPVKSVRAEKLTADFKANAEEAKKQYAGEVLEIEGVVINYHPNAISDRHTITLEASPGTALQAHFKPETLGKDPKVTKGQKIKFRGKCDLYNPSNSLLNLDYCELISLEPTNALKDKETLPSDQISAEMKDFVSILKGESGNASAAFKKHAAPDVDNPDGIDVFLLKSPVVTKKEERNGLVCYTMKAEVGLFTDTWVLCWAGNKIKSIKRTKFE